MRVTPGAFVNYLRRNQVVYQNFLQKASRRIIFGLNEPPHLSAIVSIAIHFGGNSDDRVAIFISYITCTKARIIIGSLQAEISAS
jgi:hypothetical protein